MVIQKRVNSSKPLICLGIVILFLLIVMDVISGFWQPSNKSVPMIQSGNDRNDDEDHSVKGFHNHVTWREAIDVAKRLSFSLDYLEEIKCQVSLIYLSSSHNRAPPIFS